MDTEQIIEQALVDLQSGRRKEGKNLLWQFLQTSPTNVKVGMFLAKLELQDQCPDVSMEILSALWKQTHHEAVGDFMADIGPVMCRSAAESQRADRKVLERIAGLLKVIHGSKKILLDTLEYSTIGGLAMDALELIPIYKAGLTNRTGKTVVFFTGRPGNSALVEMISRQLPVFSDPDFMDFHSCADYDWHKGIFTHNKRFYDAFFGKHADLFNDVVDVFHSTIGRGYCIAQEELRKCKADKQVPIQFSAAEEEKGEYFLRNILKLPKNQWFACVYSRDSAYYNETTQTENWFRNSDIGTYLPAIDEILARGGYVIRVGSKTNRKLNHPDSRVFDYSNSGYCDPFMDIYLMAKCRFFLGTPTGYGHVASIFQTPQVHVNAVNCLSWLCDIWIPKKMVDTRTGHYLPYAEFYKRYYGSGNAGDFAVNGIYQEKLLHVRYIDNSPEEIAAGAVEMMNRLSGTHVESAEAKRIREQFVPIWNRWKIAAENHTVASCFLELHPELFMAAQESECVMT